MNETVVSYDELSYTLPIAAWIASLHLDFEWHPERMEGRTSKLDKSIDLAMAFTTMPVDDKPGYSHWIYVNVPEGPVNIAMGQPCIQACLDAADTSEQFFDMIELLAALEFQRHGILDYVLRWRRVDGAIRWQHLDDPDPAYHEHVALLCLYQRTDQ